MSDALLHARCRVGKAPRVHIIRGSTIHTRRGYATTYCGYYANPDHGWIKLTDDEATCKRCVERAAKHA